MINFIKKPLVAFGLGTLTGILVDRVVSYGVRKVAERRELTAETAEKKAA